MAQGDGAVGLAVVVVEAGHGLVPAGRGAENAHARLHRHGARVVELEAVEVAREDRGELLHQPRLHRGGEVVRVHQLPGRLRHRLGDLRVAVPEGRDVDARREVDVVVAIDVAQDATGARFERHREQLHLAAQSLEELRAARVLVAGDRAGRRHGHVRHAAEVDLGPIEAGRRGGGGGGHGKGEMGRATTTFTPSRANRRKAAVGASASVMNVPALPRPPERARAVRPIFV